VTHWAIRDSLALGPSRWDIPLEIGLQICSLVSLLYDIIYSSTLRSPEEVMSLGVESYCVSGDVTSFEMTQGNLIC
jgi:hypothetical protein